MKSRLALKQSLCYGTSLTLIPCTSSFTLRAPPSKAGTHVGADICTSSCNIRSHPNQFIKYSIFRSVWRLIAKAERQWMTFGWLGQGICERCEKSLVPATIGSGPRESKYNLTAGRLVTHQFWRRAQDTHRHTQRHTVVSAGLQKTREDVLPDSDAASRCADH